MLHDSSSPPLADIYAELEASPAAAEGGAGTIQRRLATVSPCDLFAGLETPVGVRILIVRAANACVPVDYRLPDFTNLDLAVQRGLDTAGRRISIVIRAPRPGSSDVFAALAEDLVNVVSTSHDESGALLALRDRLTLWQRLLQRTGADGLSPGEQMGLFGELIVLRDIALAARDPADAVSAWVGPSGAVRDFQFMGAIGVDVKSTGTKEPQSLPIASELQLDRSGQSALFLVHLSVEVAQSTGETLPDAVESLRNRLATEIVPRVLFEDKLICAGYLDAHAARYSAAGYTIRALQCYEVRGDFPRIVEADLRAGVGTVRYHIAASACAPFVRSVDSVLNKLREANGIDI